MHDHYIRWKLTFGSCGDLHTGQVYKPVLFSKNVAFAWLVTNSEIITNSFIKIKQNFTDFFSNWMKNFRYSSCIQTVCYKVDFVFLSDSMFSKQLHIKDNLSIIRINKDSLTKQHVRFNNQHLSNSHIDITDLKFFVGFFFLLFFFLKLDALSKM